MTSPISGMRRFALACGLLAIVLGDGRAAAEDTDHYSGSGVTVAAPNVLFFLDNSSNWSNSAQAWNTTDVTAKCNSIYGQNATAIQNGTADPTKLSLCLQYTNAIFGNQS